MKAKANKGASVKAGAAGGRARGSNSAYERLSIAPEGTLVGKPSDVHQMHFDPAFTPEDQSFWDLHSGFRATTGDAGRSLAINGATRTFMAALSLTATEVAEILHISTSTVRRYRAKRKLYAYRVNGRPVFPRWQFTRGGDALLPGLQFILSALPDDLHPGAVSGFFLTPQPDLLMHGDAVSVVAWLDEGGEVEPVPAMAGALSTGG